MLLLLLLNIEQNTSKFFEKQLTIAINEAKIQQTKPFFFHLIIRETMSIYEKLPTKKKSGKKTETKNIIVSKVPQIPVKTTYITQSNSF